jgi:hypothetical protein
VIVVAISHFKSQLAVPKIEQSVVTALRLIEPKDDLAVGDVLFFRAADSASHTQIGNFVDIAIYDGESLIMCLRYSDDDKPRLKYSAFHPERQNVTGPATGSAVVYRLRATDEEKNDFASNAWGLVGRRMTPVEMFRNCFHGVTNADILWKQPDEIASSPFVVRKRRQLDLQVEMPGE